MNQFESVQALSVHVTSVDRTNVNVLASGLTPDFFVKPNWGAWSAITPTVQLLFGLLCAAISIAGVVVLAGGIFVWALPTKSETSDKAKSWALKGLIATILGATLYILLPWILALFGSVATSVKH